MTVVQMQSISENTPHNVEAEQQLLGAWLISNDAIDKCGDIEAKHFFDPVHSELAEIMLERFREGKLVSPVTLKPLVEHNEGLKALGGPSYLARLAGSAIASFAAKDYAEIIRDLWGKRQLQNALNEGLEEIKRGKDDASAIASRVDESLMEVQRVAEAKPSVVSFLKAGMDAITQANEAYQSKTGMRGISTGITELDSILGGLSGGDLLILAGRPSMGKTSLAGNIAVSVAKNNHPVYFPSIEMAPERLAERAYSQLMAENGVRLPYEDIGRGRMDEGQFRAMVETAKRYDSLPLEIGEHGTKNPLKLRSGLRTVMKKHENLGGIKLMVVDYLQQMVMPGCRNKLEHVSAASEFLKGIAREYDIPVIALAQLSRSVEMRENKRPILSDLRESGSIEQDADVVMFVYRPAYYLPREIDAERDANRRIDLQNTLDRKRNDLEIIVSKQRNGRLGTAVVEIDLPVNVIREKSQEEMEF